MGGLIHIQWRWQEEQIVTESPTQYQEDGRFKIRFRKEFAYHVVPKFFLPQNR